ncbi:MoaD/ThiS family protein [Pseudomonas aeruginosa]|nr:MoaD/ThiS family protein [Pseudomonas aeruginosa]
MPALDVGAATVAAALQAAFAREPRLRATCSTTRAVCAGMWRCSSMACRSAIGRGLGDPLQDDSEIYVVQALSGG